MKKINLFKTLSLGTAFLCSSVSFAQSEGVGSHGGNAVVCFSDAKIAQMLTEPGKIVSNTIPDQYLSKITSIEALDLYEAQTGQQGEEAKNFVPMNDDETVNQYIDRIVNRFQGWDMAALTRVWSSSQKIGQIITDGKAKISQTLIAADFGMLPANDISPFFSAQSNCVYATIAKQADIGNSNLKKLVIDGRLFNHPRHSKMSQAILMLHEYTLAKLGAKNGNTEIVRTVVANLIAKDINLEKLFLITGIDTIIDSRADFVSWVPSAVIDFAIEFQKLRVDYHHFIQTTQENIAKQNELTLKAAFPERFLPEFNLINYYQGDEACHYLRKRYSRNEKPTSAECEKIKQTIDQKQALDKSSAETLKAAEQDYIIHKRGDWNMCLVKLYQAIDRLRISDELKNVLNTKVDQLKDSPFQPRTPYEIDSYDSRLNFDHGIARDIIPSFKISPSLVQFSY